MSDAFNLIPGYDIDDRIFNVKNTPFNPADEETPRNYIKDSDMTDPESETGFGPIVPQPKPKACQVQNLNPLLDMNVRPIRHFTHNNMVPHYKGTLKQNMYGTGVPQPGITDDCGPGKRFGGETPYRQTLDTFTGNDQLYRKKTEVQTFFPPEMGMNKWSVGGMPVIREPKSRYDQDFRVKNNELPFEQVKVGPGLGLGTNVAARTTGNQEMVRTMPDLDNYTHEINDNQYVPGKFQNGDKPMSRFISYNLADKPINCVNDRPILPKTFVTQGSTSFQNSDYKVLLDKDPRKAREYINRVSNLQGYQDKSYVYSGKERPVLTGPQLCSARPGGIGTDQNLRQYHKYDLHVMKRPDKGFLNKLIGIVGNPYKRGYVYPDNKPGTTLKDTLLHSTRGNIQGETTRGYVYSGQKPSVTRSDTTLHSTRGTVRGETTRGYVYPDDKPSVTKKQTLLGPKVNPPAWGGRGQMDRSGFYGINVSS